MPSRIAIRDFTHVPGPTGERSTASDRRRIRYPKGMSEKERKRWKRDGELGRVR